MNRTVERAFSILQLIASRKDGITLQEIANEMDIAKSSAFVIVQTLLELNYISTVKNNENKYCLGIEIFSLGMKYLAGTNFVEQCSLVLPKLAEKYNKTAFVGVLQGTDVVYVYKYVAPNAKLATCELGARKQAYATSLGKAAIAFLPDSERMDIINSIVFEKHTERTIASKEEFMEEMRKTRERGYSIEKGELEKITSCCGAPIFDYSGRVVAAVSLSDFYREDEDTNAVAEELKAAAIHVSRLMGYSGDFMH